MGEERQPTITAEDDQTRALFYGDELETEATSPEFVRSLALVVGIDDYRHGIPPLRTAANDARRLACILEEDHGYQVHLLVEDVTLARLKGALEDIQVDADDRLLFYFAGHGVALDGDNGPAGYLVPGDARPEERDTLLPMHELYEALAALPCRHLLAILDCCFAGAFRWSSTRALLPVPEVIHRERYERFIRDPAWQAITSAAYDQRALDVLGGDPLGDRGDAAAAGEHSPFALALFEALLGAGDVVPKGQGDGLITATELYLYLRDYVETKAEAGARHRQTPGLWPLNKHDKGEYIFLVPGGELSLPPAPDLTAENNPYRGLNPYEEQHSDLFFGRDALVEELAEVVTGQPLTVVLGASGTGKSSLVKAGLLPYLRRQGGKVANNRAAALTERPETEQTSPLLEGTDGGEWTILPPLRPDTSPLNALSVLLTEHLPGPGVGKSVSGLRAEPDALAGLIAAWGQANSERKLLLVVDQFEELLTLCRDEAEREQFLRLLAVALRAWSERFRLVLTLRSDFEPRFSDSALRDWWRPEARYLVLPMSRVELREAIEGPASERVLYFEPHSLVDRLLDEVVQMPGGLPLLSFTLDTLYRKYLERRGDDRALTEDDYNQLGGVIGALSTQASAVTDGLPDDAHRETMRRIMLRLIAFEGGELARRRVFRQELEYGDPAEDTRVETVLKRLEDARLVVSDESEGQPYVEPAHDALVNAWEQVARWRLEEGDETIALQRRVTDAANEWAAAGEGDKGAEHLWHNNVRLPQVEEVLEGTSYAGRNWLSRIRDFLFARPLRPLKEYWLNALELSFIRHSINRQRRNRRFAVWIVAIVMGLLAVAAIFSNNQRLYALDQQVIAEEQRGVAEERRVDADEARALAEDRQVEAERQARIALSRQLAAQSDNQLSAARYELALLLAVEAGRSAPTSEAYAALRRVFARPGRTLLILHGESDALQQAAWSPDESGILTVERDDLVRLWDAETGAELSSFSSQESGFLGIAYAAWSPDGSRILTAVHDGTARVWDAETGTELMTLSGHSGMVEQAYWNADESRILTAGVEPIVRIWDAATGAEIGTVPGYDAWPTADGNRLLTVPSSDGVAEVWQLEADPRLGSLSGMKLATLSGHGDQLSDAAWTADGRRVLTASFDDTARVWDAETGDQLALLSGHTDGILQVAWSPDETRILTAGMDGTARVYDAQTWDEVQRLTGHTDMVTTAAWNRDGTRILTASMDGTARVWDAETGAGLVVLADHTDAVTAAAWNGDGTRILTASADGTARVWLLESRPDGGVTGSPELPELSSEGDQIGQAAWNVDETRILTLGTENRARIWDAATGAEVAAIPGPDDKISRAIWSPDGARILTVGFGEGADTARVWDAASGAELAVLAGHTGWIKKISWNAGGSRVLTAGEDGTARVWLLETDSAGDVVGAPESLILTGHTGWIEQATWNADETRIMTTGTEGTVRTWDAVIGAEGAIIEGSWASWNADGLRLLVADFGEFGGSASVWDVQREVELFTLPARVIQADWDTAGTRILTAGVDDTTQVWDAGTGAELFSLPGNWAAWNADGTHLLTTSYDGLTRAWRLPEAGATSGLKEVTLAGQTGRLSEASWDASNNCILTLAIDGTARLWDAETGAGLFTLNESTRHVTQATWNVDGTRILAVGTDGIARQYYTRMEDLVRVACERAPRNLTREEWQRFLPDEEYRATCPDLPVEEAR